MKLLTVVIPYIDSDAHLMRRAAASVAAQTVRCDVVPVHDKDKEGPSIARNRGLAQVTTPFVTFLDADDTLEPEFAEKTLRAYRPGHYVYTYFYRDGKVRELSDPAICGPTANGGVVTRVIRTETAREVGGFASLSRLEDTEFWLRVRSHGICGILVKEPLLTYTKGGARSSSHVGIRAQTLVRDWQQLYLRYNMACCGDKHPVNTPPAGERLETDVLARAMWGGNRSFTGRVTGRAYPRTGNGKQVWVDPRDLTDTLVQVDILSKIVEEPVVVKDYSTMTMQDLRNEVAQRGLDVTSVYKADLIQALEDDDRV